MVTLFGIFFHRSRLWCGSPVKEFPGSPDMIVYHGSPSRPKLEKACEIAPSIPQGAEWYPGKMTAADYPYIIDNGAFTAWNNNEEWDPSGFINRLEQVETRMPREPDFVVLPDVLQNAEKSIERSRKWADRIAEYGYPYYLPLQDGMFPVEEYIDEALDMDADGVFIGGSDEFKWKAAAKAVEIAHDHGIGVHMGKPGTDLTRARDIGVDSIDSTSIVRNNYWHRLKKLEASVSTQQTDLSQDRAGSD